MKWAAFEGLEPELAALGRERYAGTGIAMLGTVRRDGSPRVTPLEVFIVRGELMLGMMWQSMKALDLVRDPRIVVHSVVTAKAGTDGEFKLRGRGKGVTDPELREAYGDVLWEEQQWRPEEPYHLFAVDIEEVAYVVFEGEEKRVRLWRASDGG
ncbi:MAG: pyridoxamine 5'-phosphate oxidase family protein [Tepidiformaceae bacterium]